MAISQKVSVTTDRKTIAPVVYAVQGDTGRQIVAEYSDFQLASGMTGVFAFTRSDGTSYSVPATIDPAANTATAEMDQALTQVGKTKGQIKITDSSGLGSTFTFYIDVQEDLSGTPTEQQYYDIQAAVEAAAEAKAEADQVLEDLGPISQINDRLTDAEEELDNKADIDGTYPSLTAGLAEQLLSSNRVVDQTPYLYRQTALGKANATRALMRKIVGGSVVWNQLVPNARKSGTATPPGTQTYNSVVIEASLKSSHVYFVSAKVTYSGSISSLRMFIQVVGSVYGNPAIDIAANSTKKADWLLRPGVNVASFNLGLSNLISSQKLTSDDAWSYDNVFAVDLTAMFGATIADALFGYSDKAEAIAKLKEWGFFAKDYYEHDPGTIRSVEGVSAKETVGFNLWDEKWEVGYIDSNGANTASTVNIRSKNYIPILPNTTYYLRIGYTTVVYCPAFFYDVDKNFISASIQQVWNRTIVTPSNAAYMRFYINAAYGATYKNDICINLSDPQRNGTYEPYVKHAYPLDSTKEWRGIFKLDENNNLYADGDIYPPSGEASRRYALLDLGTLNWTVFAVPGTEYSAFRAAMPTNSIGTIAGGRSAVCEKYVVISPRAMAYQNMPDKSVDVCDGNLSASKYVLIRDDSYTDAATFKTAMSGVYLLYELATPTTETAEPYIEVQVVDKDGTEQFVTSGIVPVGTYTEYPEDLVGKLDSIPNPPTAAGRYVLQATVASGKVTYAWAAE